MSALVKLPGKLITTLVITVFQYTVCCFRFVHFTHLVHCKLVNYFVYLCNSPITIQVYTNLICWLWRREWRNE